MRTITERRERVRRTKYLHKYKFSWFLVSGVLSFRACFADISPTLSYYSGSRLVTFYGVVARWTGWFTEGLVLLKLRTKRFLIASVEGRFVEVEVWFRFFSLSLPDFHNSKAMSWFCNEDSLETNFWVINTIPSSSNWLEMVSTIPIFTILTKFGSDLNFAKPFNGSVLKCMYVRTTNQ